MSRFTGKTALITGAASGIGRATAIRLGSEGASLLLSDINEEGLAETTSLLAPDVLSASTVLDVSDSASCQAAVELCIERFGRLDVLCNIAGVLLFENITSITDEQWRRTMGINLDGVFFMCRAAMPHLVETKGNIVNMSSSAGLVGQAYNTAYCASKAGVLMLSKALALEYSGEEVRVNAVCPGTVRTSMVENFKVPEGASMELIGRLTSPMLSEGVGPEQIAAGIAYLASEEASYVTGTALSIDGAQTAG